MEMNKFLINPDKQVYPCCYLGNQGYKFKVNDWYDDPAIIAREPSDVTHPVMLDYNKNKDALNLENNSNNIIFNNNSLFVTRTCNNLIKERNMMTIFTC